MALTITAGCGYVNGNGTACTSLYTYCDTAYPAGATFIVRKIEVNAAVNEDAGFTFKIGCGSLSDNTLTKRTIVSLVTDNKGTGVISWEAPGDFTAFQMLAGDVIYFYVDSTSFKPDTTTSATPEGLKYVAGNKTGDASFNFTNSDTTRTIEVKFIEVKKGGGRITLLGVG